MLDSFRQNILNRRPKTQLYLASIHEALLQSLENPAGQDYHPGELHISQRVFWPPFSILVRLMVTRNGVDIFKERASIIPALKIVRKSGGGYMLLDGISFHIGDVVHESIKDLPVPLKSFHESYFHYGENYDVTISRIS